MEENEINSRIGRMKKLISRFPIIWSLFQLVTLREFILIIHYSFAKKNLSLNHPNLHRLLIFIHSCCEFNFKLINKKNGIVKLELIENSTFIQCFLRKYTRDLSVAQQIFIQKDYYPIVDLINKTSIKEEHFIIDAGANIGCAALYLMAFFPQAQIVCIEPEKSNYDLLKLNVGLNFSNANIEVIKKALWSTITTLNLRQRDHSNDAFHVMEKKKADEIIDQIDTCTIEQVLLERNQKKIDILKIDIEGAEKVLFENKHCLNSFLPNSRFVAVEVHEEFISESKVQDVFKDYCYEVNKSGEYLIAHKIQ